MIPGPHYIKANKRSSLPKRVIFFDTETNSCELEPGEHEQTYRLGVGVYQRIRDYNKPYKIEWIETKDSSELCHWILAHTIQKERLYVISSNIWFDLRVSCLLQLMWEEKWKNTRLYANGMTLIMMFTKAKSTIVFLNLQNFFRTNVEQLGIALNLPKLKANFNNITDADLMIYCRRDTEIIHQSINKLFDFLHTKDLGYFAMTFPSIAFNTYRHRFMKVNLLVHQNPDAVKLERASYFGGRVECFRLGHYTNLKLVKIDTNSMYPYLMMSQAYPVILQGLAQNVPLSSLKIYLEGSCVCAQVELETNEPVYVLKQKERAIFPIGHFTTTLSTPCLRYALEHNHIRKIINLALYKQDFIFKEYVDFFYSLRMKYMKLKNKPFESLCKYLLVSLYGKFGQRADLLLDECECDYNIISRLDYFNIDTQKQCTTTKFFGRSTTVEKGTREGINSIVSIASHVCEFGRLFLWKAIKKIGIANVYYCDTDCIIFDKTHVDMTELHLDATHLGAFKLEKEASTISILGLKDYVFGGETKIKGVSTTATQVQQNVYEQVYFPGIWSDIRSGLDKPYVIHDQTKKLTRTYTKGTVTPNGVVEPFVLTL